MSDPTQWMPPRDDHRNEIDPRVVEFARGRATTNGRFSPLVFVTVLLWPKITRGIPPYYRDFAQRWEELMGLKDQEIGGTTAAAVLNVIIQAMGPLKESPADFGCFLSRTTIAQRSHSSVRVVRRVLRWQKDAPLPLVHRSKGEQTNGIPHRVSRFTLITHPIEYAQKRDQSRTPKQEAFDNEWYSEDVRRQVLDVQGRQIQGHISEDERDAAIAALEKKARGNLPQHVRPGRPKAAKVADRDMRTARP
jgi:hypothetical protein